LEIKGLKEKLGVTDDQLDDLRKLKVQAEAQQAFLMLTIWRKGGNIHRVDEKATAKRRKSNKVARKQRRVNRVR
jgi:hypothetical protein